MIATNHLSDFAFDRLMTGELDGTDQQVALRTHIEGCPVCTERQNDLARGAQAFAASSAARRPPSLRMSGAVAAGRSWWRPRARARVLVGAFITAGMAAAMVVLAARPGGDHDRHIKGGPLKLEAFVKRTDGAIESLLPGSRVVPGDALRFAVSAPFDGFFGLVSADAAGNVMSYLPGTAPTLLAVPAGDGQLVDGSIELDQVLGNERLVAFLCHRRLDISQLLSTVRSALASAAGDPKRMDLVASPAGCVSTTLWFEKVPRP